MSRTTYNITYTRVIILLCCVVDGLDISGPFPFSVYMRTDELTDGRADIGGIPPRIFYDCIANPDTTLMVVVEVMWVRRNNGGAGVVNGFLIDHHYARYFILLCAYNNNNNSTTIL